MLVSSSRVHRMILIPILVILLPAGLATGKDPGEIREIRQVSIVKDLYPFFSPDGERIVFHSNRGGGNYQILTMNLDGSDVVTLTDTEAPNQTAVFSPGGEKIAFQSERDGNRELYVMDADGGNPINITSNPHEDSHPKWSADGRWIVFASNRDGDSINDFNIFLMNTEGGKLTRLTETIPGVEQVRPMFSPDGRKIVFNRDWPDGRVEIHILELE